MKKDIIYVIYDENKQCFDYFFGSLFSKLFAECYFKFYKKRYKSKKFYLINYELSKILTEFEESLEV